jgi:glycosyltransferase involved in cell wall biosynthesis
MKIVVVNHAPSFSIVPKLVERTDGKHAITSLSSISDSTSWDFLRVLNPDIVFCDWAVGNAEALSIGLSKLARKIPLVIRLHGYESHDVFLNRINWKGVARLVTVSPWFERLLKRKVGDRVEVVCIENGVDLERFKIRPDIHADARMVAWVGYLNQKKGPALLRCVAASMQERQFDVAGKVQCENTGRLLAESSANLRLIGWVDPAKFLPGHAWIMSTSVTESFSYAVAEGMACGLTPLVHAWPGATELWPPECCWRSIDKLKSIELKDPEWCRRWVADRYSADAQIDKFIALFESLV